MLTYSFLEIYVSELYEDLGIEHPCDIKIETIAEPLGIMVERLPIPHLLIKVEGVKVIVLDTRTHEFEQRYAFFHELCHSLRHEGCQTNMDRSFSAYQESEADLFALYALMPGFMITEEMNVYDIAERFKVTIDLAQKRVEMIRNQYIAHAQ